MSIINYKRQINLLEKHLSNGCELSFQGDVWCLVEPDGDIFYNEKTLEQLIESLE